MSTEQHPRVAEIIRFKLNPGVSDEAYIALNAPSQSYMGWCGGFISRQLSKGEDGQWTDYVVWDNMESAQAAMEGFMAQDFAPKMMSAIDKESLVMEHQPILWQPS